MVSVILIAVAVGAAFALAVRVWSSSPPKSEEVRPIPGPPGLPIIGNLREIPTGFLWYRFTEWCDKYGPLVRFNIAGHDHVIVNTEKIANDLMRERGNIYSSRPQIPMAAQLLSQNMRPVLLPYGDTWRNGRKLMHHLAMPAAAKSYEPIQEQESVRVLYELLHDGAKYEQWFERYAAGLIMQLAFGQKIITGQEEPVRRIYVILDHLSRLSEPAGYLVNIFPVLLNLPSWLAPFKREAARLHAEELSLFSSLVKDVEMRRSKGDPKAERTFSTKWLEDKPSYGLTDPEAYYVLGTLFEAGAGTTAAAMMSFVLAMVLYPEKFQKLKDELDTVVGSDRLPTFEDFPDLPYMRACVKETLRWRPVTPTNIPHELTRDDVYDGYLIKRGTVIQVNQWGIHREPELYPNPDAFLPERWLEASYPTYREPLSKYPNLQGFSAFGFGRRICPGLHIAERSLYLLTARISWAFDIGAKPGVVYRDDDYLPTGLAQPKWFDFKLAARDDREKQVQQAYQDSDWARMQA